MNFFSFLVFFFFLCGSLISSSVCRVNLGVWEWPPISQTVAGFPNWGDYARLLTSAWPLRLVGLEAELISSASRSCWDDNNESERGGTAGGPRLGSLVHWPCALEQSPPPGLYWGSGGGEPEAPGSGVGGYHLRRSWVWNSSDGLCQLQDLPNSGLRASPPPEALPSSSKPALEKGSRALLAPAIWGPRSPAPRHIRAPPCPE